LANGAWASLRRVTRFRRRGARRRRPRSMGTGTHSPSDLAISPATAVGLTREPAGVPLRFWRAPVRTPGQAPSSPGRFAAAACHEAPRPQAVRRPRPGPPPSPDARAAAPPTAGRRYRQPRRAPAPGTAVARASTKPRPSSRRSESDSREDLGRGHESPPARVTEAAFLHMPAHLHPNVTVERIAAGKNVVQLRAVVAPPAGQQCDAHGFLQGALQPR
jgi:hypothetical protein